MKRREFIALAGAAASHGVAVAQTVRVPTIGWLGTGTRENTEHLIDAFWSGMRERGYVEGRNVVAEYRWAEGHFDRLPVMATDLVQQGVAVIFTEAGLAPVFAARNATNNIPIVFAIGADPVEVGLVASLSRPGGTLTGATAMAREITGKRLSLQVELSPQSRTLGVLINPNNVSAIRAYSDETGVFQTAARALGVRLQLIRASTPEEIVPALKTGIERGIAGIFIVPEALFIDQRAIIAEAALKLHLSASAELREFAEAGGLMSYGMDLHDQLRTLGVYVARILGGEKPAGLPVIQAARFEFVINVKTARALGLTLPPTLLAIADQVIE